MAFIPRTPTGRIAKTHDLRPKVWTQIPDKTRRASFALNLRGSGLGKPADDRDRSKVSQREARD